ncbi:hypothetical protein D3C87_1228030 [compost metagenome]
MSAVRSFEVTASARILPLLMKGRNSDTPAMPTVTWPPMIDAEASPPPANGT